MEYHTRHNLKSSERGRHRMLGDASHVLAGAVPTTIDILKSFNILLNDDD